MALLLVLAAPPPLYGCCGVTVVAVDGDAGNFDIGIHLIGVVLIGLETRFDNDFIGDISSIFVSLSSSSDGIFANVSIIVFIFSNSLFNISWSVSSDFLTEVPATDVDSFGVGKTDDFIAPELFKSIEFERDVRLHEGTALSGELFVVVVVVIVEVVVLLLLLLLLQANKLDDAFGDVDIFDLNELLVRDACDGLDGFTVLSCS